MISVSLKNYIFYCYLIFGVLWYVITNYELNPRIIEYIELITNLIKENKRSEYDLLIILLCLPFELFVGRCMYLLRYKKQFEVTFLFKHRVFNSKNSED